MPWHKDTQPSSAAARPLGEQLKSLPTDKLTAIFQSVLTGALSNCNGQNVGAGNSLSAAAPGSPSKRKLTPVEDLSSPSTPSPTKKRAVDTTPGSAVIRALESLTAVDSSLTPVKRSICACVLTEKAAIAATAKGVIASGPKASSPRLLTASSPALVHEDSSDNIPAPQEPSADRRRDAGASGTANVPLQSVDQIFALSDHDDGVQGVQLNKSDMPVMDPSLQDPQLQGMYDNLPHLDHRSFIDSYGYDKNLGLEPCQTLLVSDLVPHMTSANLQSLLQALMFVKHGYYINPSRTDPALLTSNNRRLALRTGGTYATSLMAGAVTQCELVGDGILAGSSNFDSEKYFQHRVSLMPFGQEIVREVAVTFDGLNLPAHGVKGKRAAVTYDNGYTVPKPAVPSHMEPFKAFKSLRVDAVPCTPSFVERGATKTVLEYDDIVPIYDGRSETGCPFLFQPADFDDLPRWRAYANHRSNIPLTSVVVVGYLASWFTNEKIGLNAAPKPNVQRFLSTNVLFVIVLNTPSSVLTQGNVSTEPALSAGGKGNDRH
ncbi:hypothetical protein DXG01_014071 [Tephrocybe rancida]|nr:hypothetical protein DXG01_014071 [Tephrocybe rancida]